MGVLERTKALDILRKRAKAVPLSDVSNSVAQKEWQRVEQAYKAMYDALTEAERLALKDLGPPEVL